MFSLFKSNKYFLWPYLLILLVSIAFLVTYTKAEIHLWINYHHSPFFDHFFKYFTHLGDFILAAILLIIMLFIKLGHSFLLAGGLLISTIFVQSLKVFIDNARPVQYFKRMATEVELHFIAGVDPHNFNSFPSGHTTTAFVVFFFLSIIIKRRFLQTCCLIIAVMIGYSRIYLSQHFLIDVVAGSLLGILSIMIVYIIRGNEKKSWWDKSLLNIKI